MIKMGVQQTSLQAYKEVSKTLSSRQIEIIGVFYMKWYRDWTNMELANELKWSINRVTTSARVAR